MFEYERLVQILLHGVSYREQEGFVQRIAIYLLNSLACQVDGSQKLFLGDLGAISVSGLVSALSHRHSVTSLLLYGSLFFLSHPLCYVSLVRRRC